MQTSEDFFKLANPRGFTNPGTEAVFLNQLEEDWGWWF
jgi:hypothetical protein